MKLIEMRLEELNIRKYSQLKRKEDIRLQIKVAHKDEKLWSDSEAFFRGFSSLITNNK
ncbi:hypothetical protein [Lysinibacillus fusiformis]